jgi:putative tryptophan/tyrosine transport system substrate-binding protein
MRRRDFIAMVGSVAVVGPGTIRAAVTIPHVAFLAVGFGADTTAFDAIREGLRGLGDVEGEAFVAEPFVSDDAALIPHLAEEVVAAHPAVIVTINVLAVSSLLRLTQTIPIVVAFCADPVSLGFSKSVARPTGSVTGILTLDDTLLSKRIELLGQIAGPMKRVGLVYDVGNTGLVLMLAKAKAMAAAGGPQIVLLGIASPSDVATVLDRDEAWDLGGLIVAASPVIVTGRANLIAAAIARRMPALHTFAFEVEDGALASYGAEPAESFQRAAEYADRLLHGAKVADLPFESPRSFHLTLNLKTAKAIGLTLSPTLLALADEVVE